jgi:hypothetical protein
MSHRCFASVVLAAGVFAVAARSVVAADTADGLANWFETVAEAERLAGQGAAKPAAAGGKLGPANPAAPRPAPAPGGANIAVLELKQLIDRRNQLVDRTKLFALLEQVRRGEQLDPKQEKTLRGALRDWFKIYFEMRDLQPLSRRDPNLVDVTGVLAQATGTRKDFVEGRILGAVCQVYGGKPDQAAKSLEQASDFLSRHALNPSPIGHDCCAAWLMLGQPEAVTQFIEVLKDLKAKKALRDGLTPFQVWLVATHAWQKFRYNEAKEYFELALKKANVWAGKAAEAPGLVADAASFYLLAGANPPRDPTRGEKLLGLFGGAPPASWAMQRAQAALKASQATQAAAQGDATNARATWAAAVSELEQCRQDCLPVLDVEIDAQLQAYRDEKVWYRERPKPVPQQPVQQAAGK